MSVATNKNDQETERRKTAAALVASIVLHLVLILFVALVLAFQPPVLAPPAEEEAPVELTIIAPPEAAPDKPAYIETTESQQAEKPPEKMVFESDKDTRAASEQPPAGDAPVPTQTGEEIPSIEFENREHTAGPEARSSTPAVAQQPQQSATPEPTPEATPEPTPEPTPRPTAQIALLEPPKPRSTPRPETPKPVTEQRPSQPAQPPGYQPQTRITRIRGNISNRGRAAADATATPLGKYKKMLSDAIGSRWYYYVNQQMSLLNAGTVEIRFIVSESGKVERVKVVSNSSNESFASCSVGAIMEAEIPPIPKEIVPMLENGRIEIEYSFTILTN